MKRIYVFVMISILLCLSAWNILGVSEGDISAFQYVVDEENKTVLLTKYISTDTSCIVSSEYMIDGEMYDTIVDSKNLFNNNKKITSVKFDGDVQFLNNSMSYLFANCQNLTSVDLSKLSTEDITDMSFMFYYCLKIPSIDVSNFDVSNVITMESMFDRTQKMTSLTGYENWNTSNLLNMYKLFNRVSFDYSSDPYESVRLQKIDISKWDLDQVLNSGWCFQQCRVNHIVLPDNLAVISAGFFNHTQQLIGTSYTIPSGVKRIGYGHTFYDMGRSNFVEFKVAEGNTNFKAVDGILYSMDGSELLAVPRAKTFENGVFEIPEGVTFIPELCFSRNTNIKKLLLPDSYVMRQFVMDNDPQYIIYNDNGNINWGNSLAIATYLYTGVVDYEVKDSNPNYSTHDGLLYSKDMSTLLAIPNIYNRDVVIPEGVKRWEAFAYWEDLEAKYFKSKRIVIPSTMTFISGEQVDWVNMMKKKYGSQFTIVVHEENPVYRVNESGYLEAYSISESAVYLDEDSFVFDGSAHCPNVKITFDDLVYEEERRQSFIGDGLDDSNMIRYLVEGVDYTVSYENNVHAGKGKVIITGLNKYSGVTEVKFDILPIDISDITLTVENMVYTGEELTCPYTLTTLNNLDVDVEVTGHKATQVGAYELVVTGVNDFSGSVSKLYYILPDTSKIEGLTIDNVTRNDYDSLVSYLEMMDLAIWDLVEEDVALEWNTTITLCEEMVALLDTIEALEQQILAMPDTIQPDELEWESMILDAYDLYYQLSNHGQSLVDEELVNKLHNLYDDLSDYAFISGDGSNYKQGGNGLVLVVNGSTTKFKSLLVDNNFVDADQYTIEEGSTIITISDSYLQTLEVGTHEIMVQYNNGQVNGAFTLLAKDVVDTADSSNYIGYVFVCLISCIVLIFRKYIIN